MIRLLRCGLALLALLLMALPALASTSSITAHHPRTALWIQLCLAAGLAGAVAYKTPGSGVTAPTAAQGKQQTLSIAEVTFADSDTTFPITHNFGLGTTGASPNTGQDLPKVTKVMKTPGTAFPALSVAWTDGNTITINKANTTFGSGCVVTVYIERPHSLVGVL